MGCGGEAGYTVRELGVQGSFRGSRGSKGSGEEIQENIGRKETARGSGMTLDISETHIILNLACPGCGLGSGEDITLIRVIMISIDLRAAVAHGRVENL